jgi:hypothetical protein
MKVAKEGGEGKGGKGEVVNEGFEIKGDDEGEEGR